MIDKIQVLEQKSDMSFVQEQRRFILKVVCYTPPSTKYKSDNWRQFYSVQ